MNRISNQMRALGFLLTVASLALPPLVLSQGGGTNPELQQKVAALKQSVAQNQQALHQYTWTETQVTFLKGETKSTKQFQCQYGPDGKVQKTSLDGNQPPPQEQRGLRGRVIEKKTDEMKDYMGRVASLIQSYVPPEGYLMQASFQNGKAAVQPTGNGTVMFVFHDYSQPGDNVTLTFDTAAKKVQGYNVNTYLDSPDDAITLKVVFDSLPDGTNYTAQSVLDATAKQIQIRTTSSGFNKL